MTTDAHSHGHEADATKKTGLLTLTLGSIGVVYGDIGTSPLYAFKESIAHLTHEGERALTRGDVLGVISLMIWALIIIVTTKYVGILLRLDNKGEGGTLTLMALVQRTLGKRTRLLFVLGIVAAGLFYGDCLLTPAISVMASVEGLATIPALQGKIEPFILPLACAILVVLFLVQKKGTSLVGAFFGPICLVWFLTLGALGASHIWDDVGVLLAVNPYYAVQFLLTHGGLGFVVVGSVFLTVTGAEALYADMGHFGRKPIALAWVGLIFPCLVLNYLGQGAMVLAHPDRVSNPFFLMAPTFLLPPLVLLATMASVIASQAVISGAFSMTQQAIQLGLLPRLQIQQTSEHHLGQIYMPQVNYMLLAGVVLLVLAFRSSSALASAYGISVTGEMIISSLLMMIAIWKIWKKPLWLAVLIVLPFLMLESMFFVSNMLKFLSGGYVPLLIAGTVIIVMWTWVRGTAFINSSSSKDISLDDVLKGLEANPPTRVKGTAIFLSATPEAAPTALLHNLKHNQVLHEHIIILTVKTLTTPRVPESEAIRIEEIAPDIHRVTLKFGYMETPSVTRGLAMAKRKGLHFDIYSTSFFLSRRSIIASKRSGMPIWQDHIYIFLARNATSATEFFHIPVSRVVELGTQVVI